MMKTIIFSYLIWIRLGIFGAEPQIPVRTEPPRCNNQTNILATISHMDNYIDDTAIADLERLNFWNAFSKELYLLQQQLASPPVQITLALLRASKHTATLFQNY
jgi:hypothetical protein